MVSKGHRGAQSISSLELSRKGSYPEQPKNEYVYLFFLDYPFLLFEGFIWIFFIINFLLPCLYVIIKLLKIYVFFWVYFRPSLQGLWSVIFYLLWSIFLLRGIAINTKLVNETATNPLLDTHIQEASLR